jgi:hypothetical protein
VAGMTAGREFPEPDAKTALRVAIVNELFSKHYLSGKNAMAPQQSQWNHPRESRSV